MTSRDTPITMPRKIPPTPIAPKVAWAPSKSKSFAWIRYPRPLKMKKTCPAVWVTLATSTLVTRTSVGRSPSIIPGRTNSPAMLALGVR